MTKKIRAALEPEQTKSSMNNTIANAKKPKVDVLLDGRDREWHRCIQYMKSAQKQVDDGSAIPDYNVRMESTLHTTLRMRGGGTHILVKTLADTILVLQVELSETIYDLKLKIQDIERIPPMEQRIILGHRQLADDQTLAETAASRKGPPCF